MNTNMKFKKLCRHLILGTIVLSAICNAQAAGSLHGYHGSIYVFDGSESSGQPGWHRHLGEMVASDDNTKVVVVVKDNGTIYYTTNSGMAWKIITTPGQYDFPMGNPPPAGYGYSGILFTVTIHGTSTKQTPETNWYAVGDASNGSKIAITGNSSQPAPLLTITPSNGGALIAWPASFSGYGLQSSHDLTATNWVNVTNSVRVTASENQVFITSSIDNAFFRLKSQ